MSKAYNSAHERNVHPSISQLQLTPNRELGERLRNFYRHDSVGAESRKRHYLYSERILLGDSEGENDEGLIDFSQLHTLVGIEGVSHPPFIRRRLAKHFEFPHLLDSEHTVTLRMHVILDKLTAVAVRDLVSVQPDASVRVHHKIPRRDLTSRKEFLAVCYDLNKSLLQDDSPLGVDSIELVHNPHEQ